MEVDQRRAFWAQIALGLGSVIQILGMPIIVGALQDHWSFSAAEAGYITSIDLAGLCIGAIATSAWAPRLNWKRYMAITIVLGAGMNVLCLWFHTFGALAALRFGAGLASGAGYSSSLALLCHATDTARGYSILIFAQVIANAIVLAAFPAIDDHWGPAGLFITIAIVLMATLLVVPNLPQPQPKVATHVAGAGRIALPALCLAAVAFVYVAIGSYWAYAERMGIAFGLAPTVVHHLLTASVLLSSLGCLGAFKVSRTLGQSRPLLVALGLLAIALLGHSASAHGAMYVVTLVVMQLCWNFIDIFQLGTLSVVDPTGRAAALVPAAQGIALAIGPAAGGVALTVGSGYIAVLVLSGAMAALATACYAIVHARAGF
jgi:predicted MFS family arabinose efflux permease